MSLQLDAILAQLKDFQRKTVDYAFRRMYLDADPALRFLVADEVGLGKTLVAKGLIARAVDHLQRERQVRRVDVVYVCSNAAIAHQNLNRLNVSGKGAKMFATRLTLLPTTIDELDSQPVNFISFTPGTTFDMKSRGGLSDERRVLYWLLQGAGLDLHERGLARLLQGSIVKWATWHDLLHRDSEFMNKHRVRIEGKLGRRFRDQVRHDAKLVARLQALCTTFAEDFDHANRHHWDARYGLIGELRTRLARVCVDALEPDLVVLDEFQRFKHLLDGDDEAAQLARVLWSYRGTGEDPPARTLLLSATPYKMVTLDHEGDDDHYKDFVKTTRFLLNDDAETQALRTDLDEFRRGLYGIAAGGFDGLDAARTAVQGRLLRVMVRTERVGHTTQRDAMVTEPQVTTRIEPRDLFDARAAADVAKAVGAPDLVEYWKSSPYLLQFMKDYEVRRKLQAALTAGQVDIGPKVARAAAFHVSQAWVARWKAVDPANARLRALADATIGQGMWRLLWMPPALPYLEPGDGYELGPQATKALVFSSWNVVPDAAAAVLSYEAERRMVAPDGHGPAPYAHLHDKRKPLLRYADKEGQPSAMSALVLFYPSPTLTWAADPLTMAVERGSGEPVPIAEARRRAQETLSALVDHLDPPPRSDATRVDRRWYWAAPAMLDAQHHPEARAWLGKWRTDLDEEEAVGKGFERHVQEFAAAFERRLDPPLGPPPDDLAEVLADLALAGPGVCASRALERVVPNLGLDHGARLSAAARIASGLRTLFNQPDTISLLRGESEADYWRLVLRHGLSGNLQAVLDEYLHGLRESQGVTDHDPAKAAEEIARTAAEALTLRTSRLSADTFRVDRDTGRVEVEPLHLRTRFALRFGEIRDDQGGQVLRADAVRVAFNSPFRPFVLASTSVGQEGLDFHTYCRQLWHWNLPPNPVDLEQREGRVHRYKGHAVRLNVAKQYGLRALSDWTGGDPWQLLFQRARANRSNDLTTYWVFETEGGVSVERCVPVPPLAREHGQLARLKRTLAVYRLAFGQPRQQDLMAHLDHGADGAERADLDRWRIALQPP
jgi:hypothetical protein